MKKVTHHNVPVMVNIMFEGFITEDDNNGEDLIIGQKWIVQALCQQIRCTTEQGSTREEGHYSGPTELREIVEQAAREWDYEQVKKDFNPFVGFKQYEKVIYNGKTYDFGYYSQTPGLVILYEEGECNMQDSFCADATAVRRKND